MDRQIIYPGQIPLDTDLLNTNKNAMLAIGKLAGAAFGTIPLSSPTGPIVTNGLAVTPGAGMTVSVAPGEIYALQYIDSTSYGSLAADTVNQVVKQGLLLSAVSLSCPAPGTSGQSINYLIQAAFSETDTGSVALPYFNSSNPTQAWSGPANSGTPQATARQNLCAVTVLAGAAATTGSQSTPSPTAGAIGLAVVTVSYTTTSIGSGNITPYAGASVVPQSGLASNVAHALYTRSVAGNTDVTLTAQEAAYPLLTLTGALTGNINLIVPAVSRQRVINNQTTGAGYNVTVKTATGTGIAVPQGQTLSLYCDGVNVLNESSASIMPSPYADATGTSDAITASYSVSNPTLYDGYPLALGIATPNATTTPTFAPTLNGYVQTARTIVKYIANSPVPLSPGDLQGDAELRYDLPNTRWILQNPGNVMAGRTVPYADAAGTADAITASYTVVNPTLADGYQLGLGIASPNTTTTPTFAPTLNGVAQTAHTIVKYVANNAVVLAPGDLQGDAELRYDLFNTRWVLQNPSVTTASAKLPSLTGTVASNALTIGASSQWMDFRAATLGSGAISTIYAAPANLVVPASATLGTANAVLSRIVVAVMNNGGTAEIAVANISGGLQMDETNLINTTAISSGSTAANVWYSTAARTAMPYRIIGYIESTQATAGTWATAPSTIQGTGGNLKLGGASMVQLNTANGYGTTNTTIRRFTNIVANQGSDITYADSATLGATFTINANGTYAINYDDCFSAASDLGVSINSTQLTASIISITAANQLCGVTTGAASYSGACSWTGYLAAGAVIRAHASAAATGTGRVAHFTITRIA